MFKHKKLIVYVAFALLILTVALAAGCNKEPDNSSEAFPTSAPTPVISDVVSLGRVDDNVYTNEYSGFQTEFTEDWTIDYVGDPQLVPELVAPTPTPNPETLATAAPEEYISVIPEIQATREDGANITIQYIRDDVSIDQRKYMKEDAYISLKEGVKAMLNVFDDTSSYVVKSSIPLLDPDLGVVSGSACCLQMYFYQNGESTVVVTATANTETEAAKLLKMIKKI